MFKKLDDLSFKRNFSGAAGFYLAYFFLGLIIAMILGSLLATNYSGGVVVGQRFAIVYCVVLSFLLLNAKRRLNDFPLSVVALLSGVIAIFIGLIGGLIPTAYLTTVTAAKKRKK
jgi:hypothetical protein